MIRVALLINIEASRACCGPSKCTELLGAERSAVSITLWLAPEMPRSFTAWKLNRWFPNSGAGIGVEYVFGAEPSSV